LRKIAEIALRHYEKSLVEQGQSPDEISIRSLHLWSQILDRAIRGEADSAFFKYLDLNAAIETVDRAGFIVCQPVTEEGEEPIRFPPLILISPFCCDRKWSGVGQSGLCFYPPVSSQRLKVRGGLTV
jgi:hypothetical protein